MVRIQEFMTRMGIKTQAELADRLGTTQSSISAWSNGTSAPTHEMGRKLLRMGMTVEELYDETFPMSTKNPDDEFDLKLKKSLARLFGGLEVNNK